jgi:hypothetical protein
MMPLSRRSFLGATAALPLALHQRLRGLSPFAPNDSVPRRCLLLDAGKQCVLQESLTGFEHGLAAASICFERVSADALTCLCHQGPKRAGLQPRRYSVDGIFAISRSRRSLLTASCAESGTQRAQLRKIGGAEAPPFSDPGEKCRLRPAGLVIVPGAVINSRALAETIRRLTDCGTTVLYESGAAYADHAAFEAEQRWLRNYFGVSVQAPQELWPSKAETGRPPYVRYHWPSRAMIRDFSRVIAVSGEAASSASIAHIAKTAVACHRPVGRGGFIFLGSPLGPHLGFGDAEAQQLLEAFISHGARAETSRRLRESSGT